MLRHAVWLAVIVGGCVAPDVATPPSSPLDDGLADAIELSMKYSDYRPSAAAAHARPARPAPVDGLAVKRAPLITQQGEIVILEGGENTVSDLGDGSFGLVLNQAIQNPMNIAKELFGTYPDEFDAITVFTTFPDGGSQGSVAWYLPIRSAVGGIGIEPLDSGAFWGSGEGGALHGFINMQYVGKYGAGMDSPDHPIHAVMAQEFGHRWGSFLTYVKATGEVSEAMLGRDGSHWASTLQANGSVMDGSQWQEQGGTNFWLKASNFRFSELDQYTMGLRGPDEVPPWYLITKSSYKGQAINPSWPLPSGVTISGEREDITIEQVVAAHGARNPDHLSSQKDFRLAIVLVTRPGEDPAALGSSVERLEQFRLAFEQVANQMSDGRMRVCTQVTGPCDSAGVALESIATREHEGNGDGIIDPGETVAIDVTVKSTGFGDAPAVTIDMEQPSLEGLSILTPSITLGDIPEGGSVESDQPLLIKIPPAIGCGESATVPLKLRTDGRFFPAQIQFDIGVNTIALDALENPDVWTVDPYATDTATGGVWEVTSPKGVDALYTGVNLVSQPGRDHSPDGVNALVTGPESGTVGEHDVDDGSTTAVGPVYDISEAVDPLLTWYAWHFAYDFNTIDGIQPVVTSDALYTEISVDEGLTWTIIDAHTESEQTWVRKEVRLSEVAELTGTLQLRFTMSDDAKQTLGEAAVDDIRIWDESLVCRPDLRQPAEEPAETTTGDEPEPEEEEPPPTVTPEEPTGCQHGSSPNPGVLWLLGLALLLPALRRQGGATC